ncbi:MAG: polysaccharide deacetylase family protein [Salibacteraceae bacterium]
MMYLAKTPPLIKPLYRDLDWDGKAGATPVVYLTFDDGPIPEITPWVLEQLEQYNAKATFFCIGDNVRKHPEVYQQVIASGHTVGNHTFNHLNGWDTPKEEYLKNIAQCAELVESKLLRPPYGKITRAQIAALKTDYRMIMWGVLSADFDQKITPKRCLNNVIQNVRNGSIVVFHDSLRAEKNLRYALPHTLEHFHQLGYTFAALTSAALSKKA